MVFYCLYLKFIIFKHFFNFMCGTEQTNINFKTNLMGRTQRLRKKNRKLIKHIDMSKVLNLQKALRLKCPNLQIKYFNDTGWGVRCKKKIEEGEILIALPLHHLITTEVPCDIFSVLKFENQIPQFILSIFLIYECHIKKKSKYYEYIQSLPESFTNPYFCLNDEIKLLPEFIKKEVMAQIIFLEDTIQHLCKIIGHKFCVHCKVALNNIFTREKFVWAWFIVNTRSVYYEDIKHNKSMALAPFLDLFNHSDDAVTKMFIDFESNLYILKTNNHFKKFEQVFIKYGDHSNLKLYLEYGFILHDNSNDFIEFSFEEVVETAKRINVNFGKITRSKYKFIKLHKLNQNLLKSKEFSWNFKGLILILISTDQNISVLQSKIYSNSFSDDEDTMIQKICEAVSQKKYTELKESLIQMETVKDCTPSFEIAKTLIQNYINLL